MKKIAWLLGLLSVSGPLLAVDLMQIYRDALANDQTFAAARATVLAGREKEPQGLAGLLPNIGVSGNTVWNENDIKSGGASNKPHYNSNGYTVSLIQPVFRWQNWITYGQSKLQVVQAEANFAQAKQDVLLRAAQAYFDLLNAQDNLDAVRANKAAIAEQLEAAKKSFEVGTATITDTLTAQSRYDLAVAQEIAAQNDLEVKRQALRVIIGKEPGALAPVKPSVALSLPQPASIDKWVEAAERDNIAVQVQAAVEEIAAKEIERQHAGHYPTLDLTATTGHTKALTSGLGAGSFESDFRTLGLQLSIPIYQGGLVVSREREAVANRQAAASNLEATRRTSALSARQYYLGVANGVSQVKALEAALVSSQSALDATKLGYQVGVSTNVDVLNAEQQVYGTRRDLAKARYDTLLAQLRLKAAVGALGEDDVQQVNALLDPLAAR